MNAGDAPDPEIIAESAGLRYLDDDRPGILRRRRGKGFSYEDQRGRPVSARERERIRSLVIPPAWEQVWIAPESDAHLLVTGVDVAGRKQYLYHPAWREAADEAKFARLPAFAKSLAGLRARIASDLRAEGTDRLCAAALRLVDESLIRPGSRRHAEQNDSIGATTLRGAHVQVGRQRIVLEFSGKSGVEHHVELRDPALARVLSDLIDASGERGLVFASEDGAVVVDERRLNRYIEDNGGAGFSAKDFRTWGATSIVAGQLAAEIADSEDKGQLERAVRDAISVAADALANTVAVCRGSYVAPTVLDAFETGRLAQAWATTRRGKWLSRAERTTQRILDPA